MPAKYTVTNPQKPRAYKQVLVSDLVVWLDSIETYALNRIAGMFPRAAAGSADSKTRIKTIGSRIAHFTATLGLPPMDAHSDPEALLGLVQLVRKAPDFSVAVPVTSKRSSASETSGCIYVVGYSNGDTKVGMTATGRFWGRMSRFNELRRSAERHGLRLTKVYATPDFTRVREKEAEVITVLRAFFPKFTGEYFHGADWEEVCDVTDRVLEKYLPVEAT